MLKALELNGFKSFADKTRFEFPAGITVVVGPNGSGKSNVVDAIKWVLGAQSVKSLRGKEMADVIFNGSKTRKGLNACEATLTFDNASGVLAVETKEVHVTRRVYRSGEAEYLINRQPCRLRDIRDLFAGTGAATEAYSVIEQGKVDILLQSSPRDRRVIFEEAAGISRFKAKKLEATRRLERVDQNLLRLSDIVEEVESRLRSVRMQAAKARRYRQYTDRLQQLRTHVASVDWRALTEQLESIEAQSGTIHEQIVGQNARVETLQVQSIELETSIGQWGEEIRRCEARLAGNREKIAADEAAISHHRARLRDLEEEAARHRRHLTAVHSRAGDLSHQLTTTEEQTSAARRDHRQASEDFAASEQELAGVTRELNQLRLRSDERREKFVEQMRASAALGNRISGLESQVSAAEKTEHRRRQQVDEATQQRESLRQALAATQQSVRQLDAEAEQAQLDHRFSRARWESARRDLSDAQSRRNELVTRRTAVAERVSVLEELEQRLEGVDVGVKKLLAEAQQAGDGPLSQVRGLVADLLEVNVKTAPLVDVALGPIAQYVVIESSERWITYLAQRSEPLAGRLGLISIAAREPAESVDLEDQPGVIGRADTFVECPQQYAPLMRRLLGRTWFVEQLSHALALSQGAGAGLRFVTLGGELLAEDGSLVVGPRQSLSGLISRRSELRQLQANIAEMDERIAALDRQVEQLHKRVAEQENRTEQLAARCEAVTARLAQQRLELASNQRRLSEVDKQLQTLQAELSAAEVLYTQSSSELAEVRSQRDELDGELKALETSIAGFDRQLAELEQSRLALSRAATDHQVRVAKSEQHIVELERQYRQLSREQHERAEALTDVRQQLTQCQQRRDQSQRFLLQSGSEVAELYLTKEAIAGEVVRLIEFRSRDQRRRAELQEEAQAVQRSVRHLEEKVHGLELEAEKVRHERTALADRLREDYDIDLVDFEHPSEEELEEREEVDREIAELRRKINGIGTVNLEALEELEELEKRHQSLAAQFDDLSQAKTSLEQIIARINADSRRLFIATLEDVRGHFRELFSKLFGGGQADIVLDDEVEVLESGIEIIARPPGKEPRSISLLSGGEKTLTCVALLMAIFRSRPSPFCVLDEVDAALDEANIERFVSVLKEFLAWTQFILITHSKRTMTCADTIYGVTMQESGISRRVSVRFEDVSEDGHIHRSALAREQENDSSTDDDEVQAA